MIPDLDGESVGSLLEGTATQVGSSIESLGGTLGSLGGTTPPTPEVFLALLATGTVSVAENKSVELAARMDQTLDDIVEDLDEENDRKQAALARGLRAVSTALPDGAQWEQAVLQSANGDPEQLATLIREYQADEEKRQQFEETVDALFSGNVTANSDEDIVEYLQEQLGVEDREDALGLFLDLQDLLVAREVHETLERICGLDADIEVVQNHIHEVQQQLHSLLNARLTNEGFQKIDDLYFRLEPGAPDVELAIQRRFSPQDIEAGFAVERPVRLDGDGRHLTPEELVAEFVDGESGDNLLVRGQPGSGKTTFCQSVLYRWYEEDHGTVLYRRSGGTRFENPGDILTEIRRASGHVLVVVDDAVRDEAKQIFDVMSKCTSDEVTFLLNARYGDLQDATVAEKRGSDVDSHLRSTLDKIPKADVARLDEDACEEILAHFESVADRKFNYTAETLYESIRTESRAGEMLHLTYELFREGLGTDVERKYETIETPDAADTVDVGLAADEDFDPDLRRHVGLLINLLNVAEDVEVRREYLYALADVLDGVQVSHIDKLLQALDGWLVFGVRQGLLQPPHEFWSFRYLEYGTALHIDDTDGESLGTPPWMDTGEDESIADPLDDRNVVVHERLETCLRALFALVGDDIEDRQTITTKVRDEDLFAGIETDPDAVAVRLASGVFGIASDYPVLEPMFWASDESGWSLETFEACPPTAAAEAALARGSMFASRGKLDSANEEYARAEALLDEDTANVEVQSRVLLGRGSVLATKGEFDEARENYSEALGMLVRQSDDNRTEEVAACLRHLGGVAFSQGNFDQAENHYEESLAIKREIGDRSGEARSLNNLGWVAQGRGNLDDAQEYHEESLAIFREIGDRSGEASNLNNLGLVADSRGNLDDAQEYHEESLAISREIGDRSGEANSLGNLGLVARKRGNLDDAQKYHEESLAIKREIGDRSGEATSLGNLGLVARKRGNLDDAQKYYQRAREIFEETGDAPSILLTLKNLVDVYEDSGKPARAVKACEQALSLIDDSETEQVTTRKREFERTYARLSGRDSE